MHVYITSGVDGVGNIKDQVSCDFTETSFDLKIHGLNGSNYRLRKDNLEHKIVVERSKVIVKKDQIKIKLGKFKGEYSYDHWSDLCAKRSKVDENGKEKDPGAGLMDMMKDMYDSGDDSMKKAIGEAMIKSRTEGAGKSAPDLGGMDDL